MDTRPHSGREGDRHERIGRALNDFLERQARGEPVPEADLLEAHPDLADDLRDNLKRITSSRKKGLPCARPAIRSRR